MTAPQHRRPLPAVLFIGALTILTAIVWVRVLDRGSASGAGTSSACTTPKPTLPAVLPYNHDISVIVLNSTDRANLAAKTKTALQKVSFKVVSAANDEPSYGGHGEIAGVGEIRFGPSAAAAATVLRYYLPGAALVRTDSSSSTVILALGKKFTKLESSSAAVAEMNKDDIARTSKSPAPVAAPTPTC
jgi:hypothetical protein